MNTELALFAALSSASLACRFAANKHAKIALASKVMFPAVAVFYAVLLVQRLLSSAGVEFALTLYMPASLFVSCWLYAKAKNAYGIVSKAKFGVCAFANLGLVWSPFYLFTLPFLAELVAFAKSFKKAEATTTQNNSVAVLNTYEARKPRFTFAQVQGMTALKEKLTKARVEMTTEGKNGVLFSGEPGNGKTFIAEAFAGEIKAKFLEIRIGDLASRWVNQTTEQVKAAFDAARAQAPCVIFLDEVDSALRDRAQTMGMGDGEAPRLTNALLTLLADMRSHPEYGVTVVAATNHLDHLDPAAIREGRFDFKIEIPAPDFAARLGLLNANIKQGVSFDGDAAERAARRWEGFNVARMKEVASRASKLAIELGMNKITFKMLGEALRDVQGSLGGKLPENTPNLDQLRFNESMRDNLKILANRMIDIERIESMGGTVPKAVLFHGPAGTGKTAVSKALAISSKWAFLSTTGQALLNDPAELDKLVKKANDLRPCIVFIDEADDILADRATNPYGKQATNKLLAVLDGVIPLHDVMFVAATNFPEGLDAAAVRGGRFAEAYEFELPGKNATTALIADFMAAKSMAPWGTDFTPESATPLLSGLAPADVKDRLQKAINRVAGRGEGMITLDELEAVSG